MSSFMQTVIAITAPGGPEVLKSEQRDIPKPTAGELLIRILAAGVNRHDVGQRKGGPKHARTDILGLEVAGEVVEVAPDVTEFSVGQKVCALIDGGGYAEYATAPASCTMKYPTGFSDVEAASVPEGLFTAWYNLFTLSSLGDGDIVLIHGGTSGVGTLATQLLVAFGHEVFTTCGDERKCKFSVSLGAGKSINYKTENFVEVINSATGGKGVNVILDMSGGAYASENLDALAFSGKIIHLSSGSGGFAPPLPKIMAKSAWITGSRLRPVSISKKAEIAVQLRQKVWPLLGGKISPVIDSVYPLSSAADAHRAMERNQHIGKIILQP